MARPSSSWRFVAASASVHLLLAPLVVLSLNQPQTSSQEDRQPDAEVIEVDLDPVPSRVGPRTSLTAPATSPRLQTQIVPRASRPATHRAPRPTRHVTKTNTKTKTRPPTASPPAMRLTMRSSRRSLDLNVDPASILRPGTSRSASPSSAPPKTDTRTQAQRLKARLDTSLARERALRNVAVGRVPPLLYGVERDAKKMFRPTWTLSENDASKVGTMGDTTKRLLRALGRSYLKALRKYATGNPDSVREESKRTKMLDGYASVMRVTTKSAAGFSCDVCADIVGTLRAARNVTLHLKQSSKRPRFDRLAISALKKALRIRTGVARLNAPKHPEKRELTATSRPAKRHRLRACYRFIAKYYRVPPIPMVGCQFDEVKLTLRCYYPGKKILNADVSLLSVEKRSDPS